MHAALSGKAVRYLSGDLKYLSGAVLCRAREEERGELTARARGPVPSALSAGRSRAIPIINLTNKSRACTHTVRKVTSKSERKTYAFTYPLTVVEQLRLKSNVECKGKLH